MPRPKKVVLATLSVADLKALLASKERSELLESRRVELQAELTQVDRELARLANGRSTASPTGKKRAVATTGSKKVRRKAATSNRNSGGASIESVVIDLLKANGAPMAFQDVLATIRKKKLVKSKAANFDGVLRQAISKSAKIKRVGRGTYRA